MASEENGRDAPANRHMLDLVRNEEEHAAKEEDGGRVDGRDQLRCWLAAKPDSSPRPDIISCSKSEPEIGCIFLHIRILTFCENVTVSLLDYLKGPLLGPPPFVSVFTSQQSHRLLHSMILRTKAFHACVPLPRSSIISIMFIARNPPSSPTLYLPPPTSPSSLLSAFRAAARAPSTSTHPILIARAFASAHRHVVTSCETTSVDSSQRLLKCVAAVAEYRAPQELLVNLTRNP